MADSIDTPDHLLADLKLSGIILQVGVSEDPNTIILNTDDTPELVYMSRSEAKLLVAALKAAIKYSKDIE